MKKCYASYYNIGKFISNIENNWRNSLYISCNLCRYKKEECCEDVLVSFDEDGFPAIITAKDADIIFGTIIDKSECVDEMNSYKFSSLFYKYFRKIQDEADQDCPFLKAAKFCPPHIQIGKNWE